MAPALIGGPHNDYELLLPVNHSRIVPRFVTSHPDHLWINRVQAIGIGESRPEVGGTLYDVYALR